MLLDCVHLKMHFHAAWTFDHSVNKETSLSIKVQTELERYFHSLLFVCSLDHLGFILKG